MIPRIKTGRSFRGAALYYLHDKGAATSTRVAWTYAINTLENDPRSAIAEMQGTVRRQAVLKQMSGNRHDGRPTGDTVMTIALAWSPAQSPDRQHMIETGQSFLKHMGWQGHEALFVAHNDTKHPHFHIILNRVHPETGMTLDDTWSKNRAQKWAFLYERENDLVLCLNRDAKYGRGEQIQRRRHHHGEWKARHALSNDNAAEADPESREKDEWTNLKGAQRQERKDFWRITTGMRRETRAAIREDIRNEFAPQWQAYTLHKAEKQEAARRFDLETRRAIRHYRRLHGVDAVRKLKERQKDYHKRQRDELTSERKVIQTRIKDCAEARLVPTLDKLSEQRRLQYEELLARQRADRAELREAQTPEDRRQARTEQGDARRDKTEKETEQEARRQARIDRYIAERNADRDRDRGDGGRER